MCKIVLPVLATFNLRAVVGGCQRLAGSTAYDAPAETGSSFAGLVQVSRPRIEYRHFGAADVVDVAGDDAKTMHASGGSDKQVSVG